MDDKGQPAAPGRGLDRWGPPASGAEQTRTLACRTVATGRLQQRHHIRDLAPFGGASDGGQESSLLREDSEPHPFEMLLSAIGACLSIGIQANAVARGLPIRKLEIVSRGDIDSPAQRGTGERHIKPLGFKSIAIEVHIDADVAPETLKALVDHAVLWSPVANTIHDPVDLQVAIHTGEQHGGSGTA